MSDHPQRPRKRRAILTCQRCRDHRLKCDRQVPCKACKNAGEVDRCVYLGADARMRDRGSRASTIQPSDTNHDADGRRSRAVLACLRCRRLKQQCDQGRPCSRCLRGGLTDCEYDWSDVEEGPSRPASDHGRSRHSSVMRQNSNHQISATNRYRVAEGLTIGGPPLVTFVPAFREDFADILAAFPTPDECRALLTTFNNFDIMFRLTHGPSFQRRAEGAISRLPHNDVSDAPLLAVLTACFCTSITVTPTIDRVAGERHMIALHHGLISFCESMTLYGVDYVHGLLISSCARLGGGAASPANLFLELGRAQQAALLIGMHRDQPGESPFERETRRRIWYQILLHRHLMADRLHIDIELEFYAVPRPLLITDAELDALNSEHTTPHRDSLTEWGYVDARADFVNLMLKRKRIMANESIPLPDRWEQVEGHISEYLAGLPPHFRVANSRGPGMPPWVHMQACVLEIAVHDLNAQLYFTHFSSPDPTIVSLALFKGMRAGHRLVDSSRALMTYILFEYVDAPSAGLWTYTMRAFTAGLLMAYYILVVPTCPESASHIAALEAMVGVLRSSATMGGSTISNLEALKTLEMLRAKIKGTAAEDDVVVGVTDPYTGAPVPLPFTIPIQNVLPGDWLEWDALFRDLFESGPPANNQIESLVQGFFEEQS